MELKDDTINPEGISTGLLLGLIIAQEVYREEDESFSIVLTSLKDSTHAYTSLHYSGNAADIRIWDLKDKFKTAKKIKERLNIHYDVIAASNHIHIEFQPRHP